MVEKRAVIFDIDGTLADISHRLHHVKNGNKNWKAFFEEVDKDSIIEPIRNLANFLKNQTEIILVSGRSDETKEATERWLNRHYVSYQKLFMRKAGDYRKDFIIKEEILDFLIGESYKIEFVVDDRPSVVAMWRRRGLVCLQCAEWNEMPRLKGLLTLMVGPSGSGKSHWIKHQTNIHPSHVVSSDQIRQDLCGNFLEQSRNDEVFRAVHEIVKSRIDNGLPAVIDATNIKRADRLAVVELARGGPVRYIVIDRPIEEKYRDGDWRTKLSFDLIAKHSQTFNSQLKDILKGDGLSNIQVIDMRNV